MRLFPFVALLGCVCTLPAQNAFQSNLLTNGGGESKEALPGGKADKKLFYDLPGWTTARGKFVAQGSGWHKLKAATGKRFIRAGEASRADLQQEVRLDALSAGRPHHLLCSGVIRNREGKDQGEIRVELRDEQGEVVASKATGLHKDKGWKEHRLILAVPKKAAVARVTLRAVRRAGKGCDICFDDVSLDGIGPGFPPTLANQPAAELISGLEAAGADKVRQRAFLVAMAGNAGDQVVRYLGERLARTKSRQPRDFLMELLALTKSPRAVGVFKQMLEGKSAHERKRALELVALLPFDWRTHIAQIAVSHKDASIRKAMLARLASEGDGTSLKRLASVYRRGETARRLEVMQAMRKRFPVGKTYANFLLPHLKKKAVDLGLRHEAMRHVAAGRHGSYFDHLEALYDYETSRDRKKEWFRWCADYNSLDALLLMVKLVLEKDPGADGALLDAITRMKSKEVGSWVRRRCITASEPLLRKAALALMVAVPWPGDLAELYRVCKDPDENLAISGVDALGA